MTPSERLYATRKLIQREDAAIYRVREINQREDEARGREAAGWLAFAALGLFLGAGFIAYAIMATRAEQEEAQRPAIVRVQQ